jgi:hypothetical protein
MKMFRGALRFLATACSGWMATMVCFGQGDPETGLLKQIGHPNILLLSQEAEKLLSANPRSVAARLALSQVAEERDRVDEALRQAHLAWEAARLLPIEPEEKAPSFPTLAIYRISELLGNLDRRSEQAQWLEEYDKRGCFQWEEQSGILYPAARLRVVALLKLGHFSEVQRYLDEIAADPKRRGLTPDQLTMDRIRVAGAVSRNSADAASLCVNFEREMRARGKRIAAGYLINFAHWALRQGEHDRALALYREAGQSVDPETRFNPFQGMAEIHIVRGEWEKAGAAIAQAWKILALKKPAVRLEMTRALRLTVARFYLGYGSPDKALEHLQSAYGEPQRMRDSLASATQAKAQAAYSRSVALHDFQALFGGGDGGLVDRCTRLPLDALRRWESEQKLAGLISAEIAEAPAPQSALAVVAAVVPSQWMDIPRVLGVHFARHLYENLGVDDALLPYASFFDFLLDDGGSGVRTHAAAALGALPAWDVMARARVEVFLAEASVSRTEALEHYLAAWRLHAPSLIGKQIPVRIEDLGAGAEICGLVARSPSIQRVGAEPAFILEIGGDRAVLRAPDQAELRSVGLPAGSAVATSAAVVRAFFSAATPLTEQAVLTLDGRVVSSVQAGGKGTP